MQTAPLQPRTVYTSRDPDGWFDILIPGEHPQYHAGKHLLQVVNREDMEALIAQWEADGRPEFLIDPDHFSMDPDKSSAAYGWAEGLRIDNTDKGPYLQVKPRWTVEGDRAVSGGAFRNASIVIDAQPFSGQPSDAGKSPNNPLRIKPTHVRSVALTNKPNIPGLRFITNRRTVSDETNITQPTKQNDMTLQQIALMMGLPETATEAQVRDHYAGVKNRADKAGEAQAAADFAEYKSVVPPGSESVWLGGLIANRQSTLDVLKGMKAAADAAAKTAGAVTVTGQQGAAPTGGFHTPNRTFAPAPTGQSGAVTDAGEKMTEEQKHRAQSELVASIRNTNPKCSIADAIRAGRSQRPELFA